MAFTITKPAVVQEGMDIILYGDPKTGKTSTLDDDNLKVLLCDLEGGSAVLSEAQNVDRVVIDRYETLLEVGKAIEKGELTGYDMVAIDSLTQFEDLVKEYIVKVHAPKRKGRPNVEKDIFGGQQDWGDLKMLITRTVKWFHSMTKRGENSIHLMWIAHVADKKEPVEGMDPKSSDTPQVVVGKKIALQGGNTAEIVMSIVDGLFYMYNRNVKTEDGKVELERGILTKPQGLFPAMARQSKRKDPLPAIIKNPVWSDIFEQLGYIRS